MGKIDGNAIYLVKKCAVFPIPQVFIYLFIYFLISLFFIFYFPFFFYSFLSFFLPPQAIVLVERDKRVEEYYYRLLLAFLETSGFYYSKTYDLSRCYQRQGEREGGKGGEGEGEGPESLLRSFDRFFFFFFPLFHLSLIQGFFFFLRRFFWNKYICSEYILRGLEVGFIWLLSDNKPIVLALPFSLPPFFFCLDPIFLFFLSFHFFLRSGWFLSLMVIFTWKSSP